MRIFVVGTGRCGTVTFSKATTHIKNYTSGHETNTSGLTNNNLKYPDNHIEIDHRMSYFIPILKTSYPNAYWVHLQRERTSCIHSLAKRQSLLKFGSFHLGSTQHKILNLAEYYYENTNMLITQLVPNAQHIWLHDISEGFKLFWEKIGAIGDINIAMNELSIKYNKS